MSLISDFVFDPQLASEYASAAFVEQLEVLSQALGVVKNIPVGDYNSVLGAGGQFVDLPYFDLVPSLITRRDLTTAGAPTDLDITGDNARAVILRRKAGPVRFTEDVFIRGLTPRNIEQEIGSQMGKLGAQNVRQTLFSMCLALMEAMDTPTADIHTSNIYAASGTKANLTFARLQEGRRLLADRGHELSTVVMHSNVFNDLFLDGLANYKVENVAGMMIVTGAGAALGLRIVVVDDPSLRVDPGADFNIYSTFLFGQGALNIIHARKMSISAERRLDAEAPYWRVLGQMDFAPHAPGMGWNSATANPDATAVRLETNWIEEYNDHREVLIAQIRHNASVE